jgi:hypothetical protein
MLSCPLTSEKSNSGKSNVLENSSCVSIIVGSMVPLPSKK